MKNCEKIDEEISKESLVGTNVFRLRRIFQTRTLTFVAPLMREETHRVIRKYKKYKDYFYRLTLTGEAFDKINFGGEGNRTVLDFMIGVFGAGLEIGDRKSKIVNYSNSQLKNHSVWMLVESPSISEINYDTVVKGLGQFNDKEGLLKMYARRG